MDLWLQADRESRLHSLPGHNPLPSATRAHYVESVYWFRRPPYLRWAAAAVLILTAAWIDLRPTQTELRPFAVVDLEPGTAIEDAQLEWRDVPIHLLPDPGDPVGTVSRWIGAGEPVLPSGVTSNRVVAPEHWWTLETPLPSGAYPGQEIQLILLAPERDEPLQAIPGIVIAPPPKRDPLDFEQLPGLVAVPAESATAAAAAVAEDRVTVILGS